MPLAGKVSHCLFDKTGTLTTDQLVPVGIINHNSVAKAGPPPAPSSSSSSAVTAPSSSSSSSSARTNQLALPKDLPALGEVITATAETAIILAACHSLVVVEDTAADSAAANPSTDTPAQQTPAEVAATAASKANANLVGDPIELAAIKGIDWSWDAATSTASPTGGVHRCTLALSLARQQLKHMEGMKATVPQQQLGPTHEKKMEAIRKEMPILESKLKEATAKAATAMYSSVQVLQRHHFSSKLQRMSVVCRCQNDAKGTVNATFCSAVENHEETDVFSFLEIPANHGATQIYFLFIFYMGYNILMLLQKTAGTA